MNKGRGRKRARANKKYKNKTKYKQKMEQIMQERGLQEKKRKKSCTIRKRGMGTCLGVGGEKKEGC